MANDNKTQSFRFVDEQSISYYYRTTDQGPETVRCAVCRSTAERLSSVWQGEGTAYNYQCRTERCPATGTIIEHESGESQRVEPMFGDRDLAVRLATREDVDASAEGWEVAP